MEFKSQRQLRSNVINNALKFILLDHSLQNIKFGILDCSLLMMCQKKYR